MGINEKAWHVGFKWTIGNEDVPAGAICVDNYSNQLHICDIVDSNKDWDVAVVADPTVYIHCADTNAAADYIKMWHDDTDANISAYGATAINFGIGATNYLEMTTSALAPTTTNVMALGTSSLNFTDIYLDSGAILYFDATDYTITHSASLLTFSAGLTVSGATILSSTLAVTSTATFSTHISIPQGSIFYLDGQGGDEWLFSPAAGKVQIVATGASWDDITLGGTVRAEDNIRLETTKKLELRDTAIYIYSPSDARLDIVADQYIHITCGANYGVIVDEQMYIGGSGVTDKHLHFGSAGYIRAANDTQLDFVASGTGQYAISLQPTEGGSVFCSGYLGLKVTDVDGDSEGELWYDNSENELKYYNGSAVKNLMNAEGGTFDGGVHFTDATKITFRQTGCTINSDGANRVDIASTGDINMLTGSSIGHLGVYGFVFLSPTTAVGDTEGQFWYDSTTNKLHFWNGSAECEVTSSG